MKRIVPLIVFLAILILAAAASFGQGAQEYAKLGDFTLESGQVIKDCSLGYRTFGALDAKKTNAILIPTWFTGRSADLAGLIGPGKLFDDSAYFLILADAIGNGVSTSPTNSAAQLGDKFPAFTIADMVRAQHQFLTKTLGIAHLRAVTGISMGGMQTFQWMTLFPDFMDRAIPIVGTPRQTAFDTLLWSTERLVIDTIPDKTRAMKIVGDIHCFAWTTPNGVNTIVPPEALDGLKNGVMTLDTVNFTRQLDAMLGHDITRPYGGSMKKTAAAIHTKALVIVASQDHMVNPAPALELAGIMGAEILKITSDYGHAAPNMEMGKVGPSIARFLK
jgi:homoserine O-acetyltransferase